MKNYIVFSYLPLVEIKDVIRFLPGHVHSEKFVEGPLIKTGSLPLLHHQATCCILAHYHGQAV